MSMQRRHYRGEEQTPKTIWSDSTICTYTHGDGQIIEPVNLMHDRTCCTLTISASQLSTTPCTHSTNVAYPFASSSSSHHLGAAVYLSAGSERLFPKYGCSHSSQISFIGSLCQWRPYLGKFACNATTLVAVMILLPSSYFAACTGGKCSVKAVGKCAPYTCIATE